MLQISNLDDQPGFAGFFIALLPAKVLYIELRRAGSGRVSGACPGAGHLANASCVYVDTDYILWSE